MAAPRVCSTPPRTGDLDGKLKTRESASNEPEVNGRCDTKDRDLFLSKEEATLGRGNRGTTAKAMLVPYYSYPLVA